MKRAIDYYKRGWNDCLNLLEDMGKDDGYDSWQDMIDELKEVSAIPTNKKVKE